MQYFWHAQTMSNPFLSSIIRPSVYDILCSGLIPYARRLFRNFCISEVNGKLLKYVPYSDALLCSKRWSFLITILLFKRYSSSLKANHWSGLYLIDQNHWWLSLLQFCVQLKSSEHPFFVTVMSREMYCLNSFIMLGCWRFALQKPGLSSVYLYKST